MTLHPRLAALALAAILLAMPQGGHAQGQPPAGEEPAPMLPGIEPGLQETLQALFSPDAAARRQAIEELARRRSDDVAAPLIKALRFYRDDRAAIARALAAVTGADHGEDWRAWMVWQEEHPEVRPFAGYDSFAAALLAGINPGYVALVQPGMPLAIRLEEIVWAGMPPAAIPALDRPAHLAASEAADLADEDVVLGLAVGGEARAYPLRILDWHEIVNDEVGGVRVALVQDALSGTAAAYRAHPAGLRTPLEFAWSGLVYRSGKLMFDRQSNSLWSPLSGTALSGDSYSADITLEALPVTRTTWAAWRARHPGTRVLSPETGAARDYAGPSPYARYRESPEPLYPTRQGNGRLAAKALVFALVGNGAARAWPVEGVTGAAEIVTGRLGDQAVALVGDGAGGVAAYAVGDRKVARAADGGLLVDGTAWRAEADALVGADGTRLPRLGGRYAYWFAWQGLMPQGLLAD